MVIRVRDTNTRKIIGTTSNFLSMIWTERFQTYGDFELSVELSKENFQLFQIDRYIEISNSDNLMIIEQISIESSDTNSMTIKGSSFEKALKRRILYRWRNVDNQVVLSDFLEYLVSDCFDYPSEQEVSRHVDWIKYSDISTQLDDGIKNLNIRTSINRGDNLGDSLMSLASTIGFGLKTAFDRSNLTIKIYAYNGHKRNIIFKRSNYNLSDSNYLISNVDFMTSTLVAGEGEENNRKMITVSRSTIKKVDNPDGGLEEKIEVLYDGINRRELYSDARDIRSLEDETYQHYESRLKERGIDKLSEHNKTYTVDGTITDAGRYVLNKDYGLGDLVRIENDFFSATVRITEIIRSWSRTGYTIYPSFELIDVDTLDISETFNIS